MTFRLLHISLFITATMVASGVFAHGNKGKENSDSLKNASVNLVPAVKSVKTTEASVADLNFVFGKAITSDSIDRSLSQLSNQHQSAFWNTQEINMYHQDMTHFADTVRYVLHDPANGIEFIRPVPGRKTSGFGPRSLYGRHFHYGIDLDLETGDTVVAPLDGVVRIARRGGGYGNFIILCHKDGLETLYGHLSEIMVYEGQEIKGGQPIGLGGSTGQSTGSHLHLEFRVFGEQIDPSRIMSFVDPLPGKVEVTVDGSWFDHLNGYSNPRYHIVKAGETLDAIAEEHAVETSQICELNEIDPGAELAEGEIVRYQ